MMSFARAIHALPLSDIKLTDSFWTKWQKALIDVTLPSQYELLVSTGRIANFRRAAGQEEGDFEGLWFNDSDVYKYCEACAYALTIRDDAKVRECLNACIEAVVSAQQADGYINTFFQVRHPSMRWRNLHMMHEMYCGGHLLEAGVAVFECLGDRRLLDVSTRFADHLMSVFGPEGRLGYCGHEEIELALQKLAKVTREAKYSDFAEWLIESRGSRPSPFEPEMTDRDALNLWPNTNGLFLKGGEYCGEYAQDHLPIRQHTAVVGHAVRAMYFYIAAADLAAQSEDRELESALEQCWNNLTRRRMYLTGGIGPSGSNEGFTFDYDLPNLTSYAETCASIGLVFWGQKMLETTGDGAYAEIVERALYNGSLSGISLHGDGYFYANPQESRGTHSRVPWFTCACCPPNIARLIGSAARFVLGVAEDGIYVHIPCGVDASCEVHGTQVGLKIESDFPWSGKIKIHVSPSTPTRFKLYLRIPDWSETVETEIPGDDAEAGYESGYAVYDRTWSAGDVVTVDLGMTPRWVESDPRVKDNLGRVALVNGPLVYALEEHDLGFAPQLFSADVSSEVVVEKRSILGGVNVLSIEGVTEVVEESDELYPSEGTVETRSARASFVPYYAWANRGANNMQVWVRRA